jgi:hypothetical protein
VKRALSRVVSTAAPEQDGHSQGFRAPNYTQVPNALVDYWLPELSGAELKVLLYLVRRTFGFHRDQVEAGLRRICDGIPGKDRGTGLHLESASKAVKALESRGLLVCERRSGGRTSYHVRLITAVYGKSEHHRSENPNTAVYGKSEHEERKSSSETEGLKERNPGRSAALHSRATPKDQRNLQASPKLTPLRVDDDEKAQPQVSIVFATPEDELREICRVKTATEISRDLLNRIRETCELRGVLMTRYLEELRPHVPNLWKNPGGFLTDFARKIGSKMSGAPSTPDMAIKESPRCPQCRGIGRQGEQYCGCQLGRDLERVERKPTVSVAASPEPV